MMVKRRVIPLFLLAGERLVKGRQFNDMRDTGDPRSAMRVYAAQDSDELIFLDIDECDSSLKLLRILELAADECDMPLAVGGGITRPQQVEKLLMAGADKVVMTSAGIHNWPSIAQISREFGSQSLVAGIEYRSLRSGPSVTTNRGRVVTDIQVKDQVNRLVDLGAGEILLNCVDRDGMMSGFDISVISEIAHSCQVPVIACGGAGNFQHLVELFECGPVSGAACASLFHFGDNNPIRARSFLRTRGIPMRNLK